MIIGLLGMTRHGKDSIGSVFVKNGFKRYAYADILKDEFCALKNITREELEERKTELRAELIAFAEAPKVDDRYHWIKKMQKELEDDVHSGKDIVITDLRRIEEIYTLEKLREELTDEGIPIYIFQVIRPLSNGGEFDMDLNTLAGIEYAHYYNLIDGVIVNNVERERLEELVFEKIIKTLKK